MDGEGETRCGRYNFEDCVFTVSRGDYDHLMKKVSENLEKAKVSSNTILIQMYVYPLSTEVRDSKLLMRLNMSSLVPCEPSSL